MLHPTTVWLSRHAFSIACTAAPSLGLLAQANTGAPGPAQTWMTDGVPQTKKGGPVQ